MIQEEFISKDYPDLPQKGSVKWSSPSNIALVKYWGKRDPQLPENPSISFTLDTCRTTTRLDFRLARVDENESQVKVFFEGKLKESFRPKILQFFDRIEAYIPFIRRYHFDIHTENSFPHSSGIASSASGMSALALCLMSIERQLNPGMDESFFNRKASFLARLGSGSACRSIEGDLIVWGETPVIEGSNDLFGIKYPYEIHPHFKNYHDTILLVHKGEKQVSSTVGHDLMHNHPYSRQRFKQANSNLERLIPILKSGDLTAFNHIMETEALSLHAMMMTSDPYFILMKPETLQIINKVWSFRRESGMNLGFTLDAGANVHLLFPDNESDRIYEFIKTELAQYCENSHYICDRIGFGAKQLPI